MADLPWYLKGKFDYPYLRPKEPTFKPYVKQVVAHHMGIGLKDPVVKVTSTLMGIERTLHPSNPLTKDLKALALLMDEDEEKVLYEGLFELERLRNDIAARKDDHLRWRLIFAGL